MQLLNIYVEDFHNTMRPSAPGGKHGVIKLQKMTKKKLPAWQAYQALYYEEKLKPLVEEAYSKRTENLPEGTKPKKQLAIIGEIARDQLQNETPEVISKVEEYHTNLKDEEVEGLSNENKMAACQR